jgi:hypothetical protein
MRTVAVNHHFIVDEKLGSVVAYEAEMIDVVRRDVDVAVELVAEMVASTCLKDGNCVDHAHLLRFCAGEILYALEVTCVVLV